MKKIVRPLLFAGMIFAGVSAFGQASSARFIPSSTVPLKLAEQNEIYVSARQGNLGASQAICLNFTNKNNKPETFTWTLKDAKGNVVSKGRSLHLAAGQTSGQEDNSLIFVVKDGMQISGYRVEINLNN